MIRRAAILLAVLAVLLFAKDSHAQLWSGVLAPSRGIDWTGAGIPGGLPDSSWTQSGSTIAAYSGDGSAITNALATACDGSGKVVVLGPGTFTLSPPLISFARNLFGKCVLRGSGANSTFINYSGGVNCNGASAAICISSNDGTYPGMANPTTTTWTGGFSKGATQITLGSVSGITPNQTILVLNQCDTGYSGSSCTSGSATDNNGYFICSTPWTQPGQGCNLPNFAPDGSTWRQNAWEMETVMVTAINAGGCGATCVTISQPLEHPNWASGQSPQAVIIQPVPLEGVEDLALDGSGAGTTDACIGGQNSWQAFISGVKCSNSYSRGFYFLDSFHMLIKDNYITHSGSYGDGMGIRISWGADDLIQNNIVQQWKVSFVNDGPSPGDVLGYNFFIDQLHASQNDDFMWGGTFQHATGDDFQLFEGNAMNQSQDDNIHGGHVNQTRVRNFFWGYEQCANGQCGQYTAKTTSETAIISSSTSRYSAHVGNILGTPGFTNIYLNSIPFGSGQAYQIGGGNGGTNPPLPPDPLAISTSLFWDNWDAATQSTRCNTSEVPTNAPTYPNPVPTLGCGGGTLPASFYLSSKPSWMGTFPFPGIGPDVTGGSAGQCNGPLNQAGRYNGLAAATSGQCAGSGITASAWAGHVNIIPAQACFFSMGGVPDGTGAVLSFDAKGCYGSGSGSPTAANPTFSPSSGAPPQTVTISTVTGGAFVCYNTTGGPGPINGASSCPGGSTKVTGTISVAADESIYAIAGGPSLRDSGITSATYATGGGASGFALTCPGACSSFDFGSVLQGMGSTAQTFTITNPAMATANLIINLPFGPSGGDASDFADTHNDCAVTFNGTLAPGASCTFQLQFTPTAMPPGSESTSITFTTNDSGSPHTLSLSGTGVETPAPPAPPIPTPPPVPVPPTPPPAPNPPGPATNLTIIALAQSIGAPSIPQTNGSYRDTTQTFTASWTDQPGVSTAYVLWGNGKILKVDAPAATNAGRYSFSWSGIPVTSASLEICDSAQCLLQAF